jgi:hypothetical protein
VYESGIGAILDIVNYHCKRYWKPVLNSGTHLASLIFHFSKNKPTAADLYNKLYLPSCTRESNSSIN